MGKKVLILLGDAGGGHMSAARALADAIVQIDPSVEAVVHNLSETADKFPFNSFDDSWKLVSRYPALEMVSDTAYAMTNSADGSYIAKKLIVRSGKPAVIDIIKHEKPQIVVSTHFVVSAILESIKADFPGLITVSVACDLVGFPRMLADRNADLVFCPTVGAARRMHKFGVLMDNIRYPFFPLKPVHPQITSREDFISGLGLNPDLKTLLITGGGVGTVSMLPEIAELIEDGSYQVIVICAKSELAFTQLSEQFPDAKNLRLEKFVDNLIDYFAACDLIIAKPGPATIVEIEALGKQAVFTHIIGKQEHGNIAFLEHNPNFVYQPNSDLELKELVSQMLVKAYVPFQPRFSLDSSLEMAKQLLELTDSH